MEVQERRRTPYSSPAPRHHPEADTAAGCSLRRPVRAATTHHFVHVHHHGPHAIISVIAAPSSPQRRPAPSTANARGPHRPVTASTGRCPTRPALDRAAFIAEAPVLLASPTDDRDEVGAYLDQSRNRPDGADRPPLGAFVPGAGGVAERPRSPRHGLDRRPRAEGVTAPTGGRRRRGRGRRGRVRTEPARLRQTYRASIRVGASDPPVNASCA